MRDSFQFGPTFTVTVPSGLRNTFKADFHGAAFQVEYFQGKFPFNPFTAPACNMSGLKDEMTCLQSIFWSYNICFECHEFS